jgi:D-alanyl-D-alanine carboxypeptidase
MKATLTSILLLLSLANCQTIRPNLFSSTCEPDSDLAASSNKYENLQPVLDSIASDGIPGIAMAVYSKDGWWTGTSGFAKIENKTPMQSCHLQYLQSIAKLYMAVGILKLFEEGKVDLDAPITKYLNAAHSKHISRAGSISVRMLLNHSSGIPEYNLIPLYVTRLIQNSETKFLAANYLKYVSGKPLDFEPGSKYSYRNTNYVVLALIADALTGDHARYLDEIIFKPLQLTQTFYRGDKNYLHYPALVNSYWDRYSTSILENASTLQNNNVAALVGDDGIVATPQDAVWFLKGLMEGKLIKPTTIEMMMMWMKDSKGNNTYGLGLDYTTFAGKPAYGHSGGGIGAGCQLYYVPEKNLYFFVGINLGTVTESPIHKKVEKRLEVLHERLLN